MVSLRSLMSLLVLMVLGGLGPFLSGTAGAATVTAVPASTWSVFQPCPAGKTGNCAIVYSTTEIGSVIYLGGVFTDWLNPVTGQQLPVQNLAALDASTGAPLGGFATHSFNGPVFAVAAAPDQTSLFVGGKFTRVDGSGVSADHLAEFDAASGAKLFFPSRVGGGVRAILPVPAPGSTSSGLLYIGGDFTAVQGVARTQVAAVDLVTARIDTFFAPSVSSAYGAVEVRSLALGSSLAGATRLFVGGHFDTVDGAAHESVAALDPVTGAVDPTFTPVLDVASGGSDPLQAIDGIAVVGTAGGTQVAGVILAQAGHDNRAYRFDLGGNRIWTLDPNGDVQTVTVAGDSVYLGGHFTCVLNCYNNQPSPVARMHLVAVSYASSNGDTAGAPVLDTTWSPAMAPAYSPYFYGVWTLSMMNGSLVAGGVFDWVQAGGSTYNQPKIAVFPPAAQPVS